MKIYIILSLWLWLDLILNTISKNYRKITIRLLKELDDNAEIYWYSIWKNILKKIKKLFKGLFK